MYYLCSSFHFVFLMCTFFLIGSTWLFRMVSNRRVCVNHQDNFSYICGQYTHKQQCKNITKSIQLAYKYYFDNKLGDQEWPPHVCCALGTQCYQLEWMVKEKLFRSRSPWFSVNQKIASTIVIFVWQILLDSQRKTNQRSHTQTVNLQENQYLMMKQIHHEFHQQIWLTLVPLKSLLGEGGMCVRDADNSPHLLGQAELNNLVRDLELTKEKAELLGSRLQ